jgi:hypothetical protein
MDSWLHQGDRVRLIPRVAVTMNRRVPRRNIDWTKRQGTIAKSSMYTCGHVMIQWDDRLTLDQWPTNALEIIE